jgi:hypothetical protein
MGWGEGLRKEAGVREGVRTKLAECGVAECGEGSTRRRASGCEKIGRVRGQHEGEGTILAD